MIGKSILDDLTPDGIPVRIMRNAGVTVKVEAFSLMAHRPSDRSLNPASLVLSSATNTDFS